MYGCDRVAPVPQLQRGDIIAGRYAYVRKLGSGGMGTLHLAIAQGPSGFAKQVVLKMPHRYGDSNETDRESVLREARLAARLDHPSIVHTFEVIETEQFPIIVMEYLRGSALSAVRPYNTDPDAPTLPLAGWLRILSDILGALRYVHQLRDFDGQPMGLVHRDVSPQNIFLTDEGYVKLLDFGAATVQREMSGSEPHAGKLRYMPREQLLGEGVDGRVDLYAVGGLLWEALSGVRLWKNLGPELVRARILLGKLPPRDEQLIPAPFRSVVENALASRTARYSTADELDRAILDAAGGEHALWSHSALREWMLETFTPYSEDSSATCVGSPPQSESGVTPSRPSPRSGEHHVGFPSSGSPIEEYSRTERLDPQSARVFASTKPPPDPVERRPARRASWYLVALAVLLVAAVVATLTWQAHLDPELQDPDTATRDAVPPTLRAPATEPQLPFMGTVAETEGGSARLPAPTRPVTVPRVRSEGSAVRGQSRTGELRAVVTTPAGSGSAAPNPSSLPLQRSDCAYLDADGIKRYRPGCL